MFHLIHDYSKWSKPIDGYGATTTQFKVCKVCGKIAWRNIGYANQTTAAKQIEALNGLHLEETDNVTQN